MSFFRQENKLSVTPHWVKEGLYFHREATSRTPAEVGFVQMSFAPDDQRTRRRRTLASGLQNNQKDLI